MSNLCVDTTDIIMRGNSIINEYYSHIKISFCSYFDKEQYDTCHGLLKTQTLRSLVLLQTIKRTHSLVLPQTIVKGW